jgi:hypothetical protein
MRGPWAWIVAIAAGIVVLMVVTALIGADDESGETVAASEWADGVCGSVAVWRGELEAIVDGVRAAGQTDASGGESGAETPQGRTGSIRTGVDRAITATETLVTGVESAGIPDTPGGEAAAEQLDSWANGALNDLEQAEEALDEETETVEDAVAQVSSAVQTVSSVVGSGIQALADAAVEDPELGDGLTQSGTCQALREESQ